MELKIKYFNAIGIMSGTSMDGVDISLINTNGEKIIRLDKNFYLNYQLSTKLALEKPKNNL